MVRTGGFSAQGGSASGGHPPNRTSMHYLYILKSTIKTWHYIGITDDRKKRLKEHNAGKTKSTKAYLPFIIVYFETFPDKTSARKREIHLKKNYKARKEILENL
jgi:putative endonuclease